MASIDVPGRDVSAYKQYIASGHLWNMEGCYGIYECYDIYVHCGLIFIYFVCRCFFSLQLLKFSIQQFAIFYLIFLFDF